VPPVADCVDPSVLTVEATAAKSVPDLIDGDAC